MNQIVNIRVHRMDESCKRATFYVRLTTDEGFSMEVAGHRTGHEYRDPDTQEMVVVPGLSVEEARDRALMDAADWGDFLRLAIDPYVEEGSVISPKMRFETYETRRILAARSSQGSRRSEYPFTRSATHHHAHGLLSHARRSQGPHPHHRRPSEDHGGRVRGQRRNRAHMSRSTSIARPLRVARERPVLSRARVAARYCGPLGALTR